MGLGKKAETKGVRREKEVNTKNDVRQREKE